MRASSSFRRFCSAAFELSEPLDKGEELSFLSLLCVETRFDQCVIIIRTRHFDSLLYQETIVYRSPSVTGVTSWVVSERKATRAPGWPTIG